MLPAVGAAAAFTPPPPNPARKKPPVQLRPGAAPCPTPPPLLQRGAGGVGVLEEYPTAPGEGSFLFIYLFIYRVGIKGKWWVMQAVPALAGQRKRCLGALAAPRCPVLTPCLSLRLQPSLVQPWQRPTRRGSSIVSAIYVSISASARPA